MMSLKSFVLAATVAGGLLCTADNADAQWRRGRVYSNYAYPSYSYSYSYPSYYSYGYTYPTYSYTPGVVYSSYSTPYYTTDGVVTASYSTPVYSSSYYGTPYYGGYYGYNSNWGYNNIISTPLYGVGTGGVRFGPWGRRW